MSLMEIPSWQVALAPLAGWPDAQARPDGVLKRMATRFLAWRAQRETVRLLNAVDGATLRDLGINDIESQVYGEPDGRMRGYDRNWWHRAAER
jgi:uncharacterized protein YjiS (DUF1127 family)